MRIYLAIYFALVGGAAAALWQGGVFARVSPLVLCLLFAVAIGLGILLAIVSFLWRPDARRA